MTDDREELRFGFSPCPNDTFAFHALVHDLVEVPGVRVRPVLADIEELNRRAAGPDRLDLTKLSVGALAGVVDRYAVMPSGAALGRGVGPLVVVRPDRPAAPRTVAELSGRRVAVPGVGTTAYLLMRLFAPADFVPVEMRFDRILDAVESGDVDAGLIIHESRFTYGGRGLACLCDVGELWELDTGLPLPLGLIAMRRERPRALFDAVAAALRESVERAFEFPEVSRAFVRAHSQELSDKVCEQHIALYVNHWTVDLGDDGRRALESLLGRGRELGLLPAGRDPWP